MPHINVAMSDLVSVLHSMEPDSYLHPIWQIVSQPPLLWGVFVLRM